MRVFLKFTFFCSAVALLYAVPIGAQDLGSSNKLFGGAAPIAKKAPKSSDRPKRPTSSGLKKRSHAERPSAKATAKASPDLTGAAGKTPRQTRPRMAASASIKDTPGRGAVPQKKLPIPRRASADKLDIQVRVKASAARRLAKPADTPKNVDQRFKAFGTTKRVEGKAGKTLTDADRMLYERLLREAADEKLRGNYAGAENAYNKARILNRGDARAVSRLGGLYAERERWEDAAKALSTAVEMDPKDAFSQLQLSIALSKPISVDDLFDRYARAEKAARLAVELSPRNVTALDQLGVAMELNGLVGPETESVYRRAVNIDPTFVPAYAHLGRLLRRRGMLEQSNAAYQKAIDRARDVASRIKIAEILQSESRFEDSESLLRNALQEDPRNARALVLLGRSLTTRSKVDEAETMYRRALAAGRDTYTPNVMLASLYLRQGKVEPAEAALMQAERVVPENEKRLIAVQFRALGDAYSRLGKRSDAARCYRIAARLDQESRSLPDKLAKTIGR